MQLKHILESDVDCQKVQNDVAVYTTDKQMYDVPIKIELQATS